MRRIEAKGPKAFGLPRLKKKEIILERKIKMILEKVKKVASRTFFWTVLSGLAGLILIINFFGEIVWFLVSQSIIVWRILNQLVPIYAILVIFVLILIVFLLTKLRKTRLNEKEMFILGILDGKERRLSLLFRAYKQRFEVESRTMSNCLVTIKQLEKKKLIKCETCAGGIKDVQDEMLKLTKKGQKRFEKLDSVIKEKAEDIFSEVSDSMQKIKSGRRKKEQIEPHNEIMFILESLANERDRSMTRPTLSNYYFKKFSNKKVADFNIAWSKLEASDLIIQNRGSTGYGSSDIYFITDEGLDYLWTYKENKE